MSIDFTSPHLKPIVTCDRCSHDSHKVENLVSGDPMLRAQGFMCEHFIRPPCTISLRFPCQIELHSVVIDPCIGGQKSCGFEIYTKSENVQSWLMQRSEKFEEVFSMEKTEKVGTRFEKSNTRCLFKFTNHFFRPREPYKNFHFGQKYWPKEAQEIKGTLRHRDRVYTSQISHLYIKITATLNATIPCVKQLAVYGQPSSSCPKPVKMDILSILNALKQGPIMIPEVKKVSVETRETHDNESTPVEYLDEITFELMCMPMLLPSGHNIDQSTLDKFAKEENTWGRAPGDPFTGLPFDDSRKPVVNSTLKSRIDQYIVQLNIVNVGRTIGRSNCPIPRKCSTGDVVAKRKSAPSNIDDVTNAKRRRQNFQDHDENLRDSLDSALGSMLSSLPSFIGTRNYEQTIVGTEQSIICSHCTRTLESHSTYRIPCAHYLCRDCSRVQRSCFQCGQQFALKDIVKQNL